MSLRIEGPARVVLEEGIDKVTSLDWHLASLDILAPFSEVLFDPGHRLLDCRHVRTKDALVAGHIGHDRCRFWHRDGEVEAGAALFDLRDRFPVRQLGRASCRERVCQYVSISVVPVSLKQKIIHISALK